MTEMLIRMNAFEEAMAERLVAPPRTAYAIQPQRDHPATPPRTAHPVLPNTQLLKGPSRERIPFQHPANNPVAMIGHSNQSSAPSMHQALQLKNGNVLCTKNGTTQWLLTRTSSTTIALSSRVLPKNK
jgi:hypothetical protein